MAKRYFGLYETLYHPLNLWAAYKQAARGKRYTPAVASFEYDLEKNLLEIERELKDESYQPGGYHSFEIKKPKRRLVNAAPFRDRVVHHALMNVIEPLFERQFIFDSYANRKFKGTHAARGAGVADVSAGVPCPAHAGRIPKSPAPFVPKRLERGIHFLRFMT